MKAMITECRVEKAVFEDTNITEEKIKRDLAAKAMQEMPFEELEKIFVFVKQNLWEDPEYSFLHPDTELIHFAAKIYIPHGTI